MLRIQKMVPPCQRVRKDRVLNREAGRNLECGSLLPLWIEKSPNQEIIATLAGRAIIYPVAGHWHHSPIHLFVPGSIYVVTAGTLYKEHFFAGNKRLKLLQCFLLETIQKHGRTTQAWAVFVNHYHLSASAPERESSLEPLIKELHSKTAREVNQLDEICGRQVWYQYWDTCLDYEKSWAGTTELRQQQRSASRACSFRNRLSLLFGSLV